MCVIREKMKDYPVGTRVMFSCSDDLDKTCFGVLCSNRFGQMVIVCDDGIFYFPDDSDVVKFLVDVL